MGIKFEPVICVTLFCNLIRWLLLVCPQSTRKVSIKYKNYRALSCFLVFYKNYLIKQQQKILILRAYIALIDANLEVFYYRSNMHTLVDPY